MSAEAEIKQFIDRILRLKEEQDTLGEDIREVYAEAKGRGYDKTVLGNVVSHLRKLDKVGRDAINEREAIFDLYLTAYETGSRAPASARVRENIEEINPDPSPFPVADGQPEPSSSPGSAKSDGSHSVVGQGRVSGCIISGNEEEQAVTDFQPPAFLQTKPVKTARDYRPHCQKPDACGASGLQHCYSCSKLIPENREVA